MILSIEIESFFMKISNKIVSIIENDTLFNIHNPTKPFLKITLPRELTINNKNGNNSLL